MYVAHCAVLEAWKTKQIDVLAGFCWCVGTLSKTSLHVRAGIWFMQALAAHLLLLD